MSGPVKTRPEAAQSGHTIQDEGSPLTDRANLNFVGSGVTVTDDSGNGATKVTISTGSAPDADGSTKGLVQLAGDLAGTAASPQIATGVIVNADVNASAAIAESKLNLASDAAAGTASRRTLGTGATQAAAGDHTHATLPSSGEKSALAGTSGTPGSGNKFVTAADSRLVIPWTATTAYVAGQIVTFGIGIFQAANSHTSASTFDPANWTLLSSGVAETEWYGHSFVDSTTGVSNIRWNYVRRVARALGAEVRAYGRGGSQVSANGWQDAFSASGGTSGDAGHVGFAKHPPFGPRSQIISLDWGVNETGQGSPWEAYYTAMRAVIGLQLVAGSVQAADASVNTGGQSVFAANALYGGDRIGVVASGSPYTITAPAWWPAGRAMWIHWITRTASTGTIAVTKNGSAAGSATWTVGAGVASSTSVIAVRVANVTAGDVIAATSTHTDTIYFDRYGPEASPTPLVVVQNIAPASGPPAVVSTAMNAGLATLVSDFQVFCPSVVFLDRDAGILLGYDDALADTLHPNNYGHGGPIGKIFYDLVLANLDKVPHHKHLLTAM